MKGWRYFYGNHTRSHFVDRNGDGSYSVICGLSPPGWQWGGSTLEEEDRYPYPHQKCSRCLVKRGTAG